jgi:ABC-type Fe3+-hydroxamate transport system substrate-binding protein
MKKLPIVLGALAFVLAVGGSAACSGEDEASARERLPRVLSADFPVQLETSRGKLTIAAPPSRVLPGNAALVDFVTLLIGPERVCALPEDTELYSRAAGAGADWSAPPRFRGFTAETLLALGPDLVLAHAWQGNEALEVLEREGIPALSLPVPETWQDCLDVLELLGAVLGERERSRAAREEHERRAAELARRVRRDEPLRALCYTNLGAGGWTAGARTTIDVLFELAGLENAAAGAGLVGHTSVDLARLLAIDPDLFVVGQPSDPTREPPSAGYLLSEPELAGLRAVRARSIVALPARLFSTASLELLSGAELLAAEVDRLFAPR